jgi:hypothetical protein
MSEPVGIEVIYADAVVEVLDDGPVIELVLPSSEIVEVVAPGPQGPVNTDYQIGGSQPTDPNIRIWYKLTS